MTTSLDVRQRRPRPFRSLAHCAALIPLAAWALLTVLGGRSSSAVTTWFRLLRRTVPGSSSPGPAAVVGHAVLSLLLGLAALVPLGIEVLFVLRGIFYGLVDPGPYDTSWGGPSRAGAWAAHFLLALPMAAAALLVLVGIAAVHRRLTEGLAGGGRAPWVIPVAVAIPLPAAVFFVAWLHQI
ncbi:MAG: hypothetical protein ABW000_08630 [Actinoplanes sp.]